MINRINGASANWQMLGLTRRNRGSSCKGGSEGAEDQNIYNTYLYRVDIETITLYFYLIFY